MSRKFFKSILGDNLTADSEKYGKINIIIIFLMFVVSAIMLLFLPSQLPILHNGGTEYPVPSVLGVWIIPVLALLINLSFIKQKRLSKINSIFFGIAFVAMTVYYITLI